MGKERRKDVQRLQLKLTFHSGIKITFRHIVSEECSSEEEFSTKKWPVSFLSGCVVLCEVCRESVRLCRAGPGP